jgi:FtsH-binding integral membrane protein
MKKFKNYINRLNWFGFFVIFLMCGGGAFSREQDPTLFHSFLIWMILGLPISLIFLFIGMKPKDK